MLPLIRGRLGAMVERSELGHVSAARDSSSRGGVVRFGRCVMTRCPWAVSLAVVWALAGPARSDEPQPKIDAKEAFAKLKSLEGEWKAEGDVPAVIKFRVTAAGSAVVEELFPGTEHEMVSVYHMDGAALKMTHYCGSGNQPRMRLNLESSTPELFVFDFDGGTNLDASKDMHMHEQKYRLKDAGTLDVKWQGYQDGKPSGEPHGFVLKRK
jgi:hypothetical protein